MKFERPLPAGVYCDLITPFADETVDTDAIEALVEWQIASGITGIVVCGLAGEAGSLTWAERRAVVKAAIVAAAGRIPVLVGTGTPSTETTRANTISARELGADGVVIVTPYYNRPSQKGVLKHFETVASVVDIPILVCHAPSLTACNLLPDTVARLAELANIAGMVDASGDAARFPTFERARAGFQFLSGDDRTAPFYNQAGGCGAISTAANIAPRLVLGLHDALRYGDARKALSIQAKLSPLHELLSREPAVAVVKHGLHHLHGIGSATRLPIVLVEQTTAEALLNLLETFPRHSSGNGFLTMPLFPQRVDRQMLMLSSPPACGSIPADAAKARSSSERCAGVQWSRCQGALCHQLHRANVCRGAVPPP